MDFTSAKGWEIFEILQDIERHEGYEEKYKSMEHEDETGPAGTGGTGVDRCAGECESGGGNSRYLGQRLQVGLLREMVHRMIHFKSRQRHSLRILQKL